MTARPRIVVGGGAALGLELAVAMAGRGLDVTLAADDAHEATRTRDLLARQGGAKVPVTDRPGPADVAVLSAPATVGAARTLCLGFDGTRGSLRIDPTGGIGDPFEATPETQACLGDLPDLMGIGVIAVPFAVAGPLRARIEDVVETLVFVGAPPWEVDEALEALGARLGPCAAQDRRGLDATVARRGGKHPVPVVARMVTEGRLGRKGGVGWYRYPGNIGRVIDPLVEDLAREEAHFARLAPRVLTPETITRAILLSLADEAAGMLARGLDPLLLDRIAGIALDLPPDLCPARWGSAWGRDRVAPDLRALADGLHPLLAPPTPPRTPEAA